ncbi:MAG: hypothetical protein ACRD2C_12840 [Acidimicrobiales bacterium]
MCENLSLIGILAEIDRAVEVGRARRADVADLLPAYVESATSPNDEASRVVGWSRRFEQWITERSRDNPAIPAVDDALAAMAARPPRDLPEPRDPADDGPPSLSTQGRRRVNALAALIAADPATYGPGGEQHQLVLDAVQQLTHGRRDHAADLLQAARREPTASIFHSQLLMADGSPGDSDPVPILQTESPVLTGRDVSRLEEFLEPAEWATLGGTFWEGMEPLDHETGVGMGDGPTDGETVASGSGADSQLVDGVRRCYREVFVVTPTFKLRPVLEVISRQLSYGTGQARCFEYHLCSSTSHRHEAHPDGGDDIVTCDEGSIVTRQLDAGATVATSKRVAFDGPFNGPALVMVAHALGYVEAFEGMVATALARSGQDR